MGIRTTRASATQDTAATLTNRSEMLCRATRLGDWTVTEHRRGFICLIFRPLQKTHADIFKNKHFLKRGLPK